jgi:lysozyme
MKLPRPALKWVAAGVLAVSSVGVGLIKNFEVSPGAPVPLKGYDDGVGVWTICWGHTKGITPASRATEAQCEQYLQEDIAVAERAIRRVVKVPVTQPIFDSLGSFTLNVGGGALASSTLIRKLNAGDYTGACKEMLRWNKAGRPPKVLRGLERRRVAESELCLSGVPDGRDLQR